MKYSREQHLFIVEHHKLPRPKLTTMFNQQFATSQSIKAISGYCKRHNLLTDKSLWHFKKGNVPFNKGNKGVRMSPATEFKKGNRPHNYKPVGSERIDTKDGYIHVKVADPKTWVLKHRLIWEQHYGAIPEGHIVVFKDKNKRNFDINNLTLLTRAEHPVFNKKGYCHYPEQCFDSLKALNKLEIMVKKRKA